MYDNQDLEKIIKLFQDGIAIEVKYFDVCQCLKKSTHFQISIPRRYKLYVLYNLYISYQF